MSKMNWDRARKLDKSAPGYKGQRLERAADNWIAGGSLDKQPKADTKPPMDEIAALRLLREGPVSRDDGPIPEATANVLLGRGLLMLVTVYHQGYSGASVRSYEIRAAGIAALSQGVSP